MSFGYIRIAEFFAEDAQRSSLTQMNVTIYSVEIT
jgi:hypothetical protein